MVIKQKEYEGSFLKSRFAYKYYRDKVSPYGNIVAFRCPMKVSDNLIDLEDSLTNDFIISDDAINFCWEIPNLCPIGAVAFQRLFNTNVANILFKYIQKPISVKGDDIMVMDKFVAPDGSTQQHGKCSVSITYSKDNVAIGHLGINVDAGNGAPSFAYSTNMSNENVGLFMDDVCGLFNDIVKDIFKATTKISL
jgi:hypothetical protein